MVTPGIHLHDAELRQHERSQATAATSSGVDAEHAIVVDQRLAGAKIVMMSDHERSIPVVQLVPRLCVRAAQMSLAGHCTHQHVFALQFQR